MGQDNSVVSEQTPPETLRERSLDAVAEYIKSGKCRKVVVMTGAGISTAAGIPDFRSKHTGLYANLARLNLPYAEAVFDIGYFRTHPEPFYVLARELYPGHFHPTISHAFIALLAAKGLLFQLFTQNIDCLERVAGVPGDKIVEAHGSFATQRCIDCQTPFPEDQMKEHVAAGKVPKCLSCKGLVKPDIVFFGEALPAEFRAKQDLPAEADLALIMGTSLTVHPFAGLPEMVREGVPRVLFNLEQVGGLGSKADDVLELGDCDAGIRKLADELGWREELESKWRSLVGEEEAERQLKGAKARQGDLQDEVERLAEEVEEVLKIEEDTDEGNSDADTAAQIPEEPEATRDEEAEDGKAEEPGSIDIVGAIPAHTAPPPAPDGIKEPPSSPVQESDMQLVGEDPTRTADLPTVVSNQTEVAGPSSAADDEVKESERGKDQETERQKPTDSTAAKAVL